MAFKTFQFGERTFILNELGEGYACSGKMVTHMVLNPEFGEREDIPSDIAEHIERITIPKKGRFTLIPFEKPLEISDFIARLELLEQRFPSDVVIAGSAIARWNEHKKIFPENIRIIANMFSADVWLAPLKDYETLVKSPKADDDIMEWKDFLKGKKPPKRESP